MSTLPSNTPPSNTPAWSPREVDGRTPQPGTGSATVFLILRRMRAPFITMITVFFVGTLGLTLIPGMNDAGESVRLTLFDSFYVMTYTAATVGFAETPWPFTVGQRLWVTLCIYLSVIAWTYALGTLLSVLQDRAFRLVRARQRFARRIRRLNQPFLILAGYGRAGELLAGAFDATGQQIVVLDPDPERIDEIDLGSFRADIPGLVADAADPEQLLAAGLGSPDCSGVLALTGDDQNNLSVAMATALLRPDLPVLTYTVSGAVADQMRAFGTPVVIDPFERFGDHLRLALHSPASYQLMRWLEQGPGAHLPERGVRPPDGRWVICGYGRLGHEMARHLGAAGVELTVIDRDPARIDELAAHPGIDSILGDAGDRGVLEQARLGDAVGIVAGTDDDATNLSTLAAARRINPALYLSGRQNLAADAALFAVMDLDAHLVPSDVVAHEVYARISSPLLWKFLRRLPGQDEEWAESLVDRLVRECGRVLPVLWRVDLDDERAPAAIAAVTAGQVRVGDLIRRPEDRDAHLRVVPLLLVRADRSTMPEPGDDVVLAPGDQLLCAGAARERRALESTLRVESTAAYVLLGRRVPAGAVWRRLSRTRAS